MAAVAWLYAPSPMYQDECGTEILPRIALSAITAGAPVYEDPTTGRVAPTNGATSVTTARVIGIALETKAAGQAVSVFKKGLLGGLDVTSINPGALVYVSDTAGTVADAAGTHPAIIGRVVSTALGDVSGSLRKALEVWINPTAVIA